MQLCSHFEVMCAKRRRAETLNQLVLLNENDDYFERWLAAPDSPVRKLAEVVALPTVMAQ